MAQKQGRLVREPETSERRQEWGTIAENALRVDRADVEVIVDALSIDHAGSFNLFYLLRKHYWTAAGAEHKEVAAFLEDAYKRVREVTDDLAIRIVELGVGDSAKYAADASGTGRSPPRGRGSLRPSSLLGR